MHKAHRKKRKPLSLCRIHIYENERKIHGCIKVDDAFNIDIENYATYALLTFQRSHISNDIT